MHDGCAGESKACREAAQSILPTFGISGSSPLTPLASTHSYVFRVEDRGRQFVLRLLPPGGPSAVQIDLQARWLRELAHEPCLCVPALVATISGEVFASVPIEGERSPWRAVLVKWVEGSPLRPAKRFATPDVLREVGAVVARMHRVSERFASDTSPARMIDADALVGSCSSLGADAARLVREEDLDSLRESAARIDAVLSSLPTNSEHVGLIHADLEPANWVFQRGKACPIDFDAFGRGFYLFDLLTVLWTHASWDDYPVYRQHLFDGYAQIRRLPSWTARHADVFQASTFYAWLNHGCTLTNSAARDEFLKWVPFTAEVVRRLCSA
jgi:Ser/Thr protein kinase RdoA (MazF antagonist)